MSIGTVNEKKNGWFGGLVDGASKALAFGNGSKAPGMAAPAAERESLKGRPAEAGKPVRKVRMKGLTLQVHRLAADGHERAEIARRTALSQDTVALLLHLTPEAPSTPDESAGRGILFRTEKSSGKVVGLGLIKSK